MSAFDYKVKDEIWNLDFVNNQSSQQGLEGLMILDWGLLTAIDSSTHQR